MQLVINPEKVSAEVMATAVSLRSDMSSGDWSGCCAREQKANELATGAVELNVTALA